MSPHFGYATYNNLEISCVKTASIIPKTPKNSIESFDTELSNQSCMSNEIENFEEHINEIESGINKNIQVIFDNIEQPETISFSSPDSHDQRNKFQNPAKNLKHKIKVKYLIGSGLCIVVVVIIATGTIYSLA